jgi:peptidylprolyl isomerase
MRRLLPALAALLALALVAAGCGDSSSGSSSASDEAPATPTATAAATPSAREAVDAIAAHISKNLARKPRIRAPEGEPPLKLVKRDIVRGKGRPARPGQMVRVQYVGVAWSTGKEFDSSWSRNQAFAFGLGAGQVIQGWDQGVAGMRPGGRRLLVIPPELGYGAQGAGGAIGPNETLVFVVDLE